LFRAQDGSAAACFRRRPPTLQVTAGSLNNPGSDSSENRRDISTTPGNHGEPKTPPT